MKRKTMLAALAAALLALSACATPVPEPSESGSSPVVQINPLAESVSVDETTARLYYGFGDDCLLAGEDRRINVPANESVETSILNELIREGPSASSNNLTRVINPATSVVSATMEGEFMIVTFSREFLEPELAGNVRTSPVGEQVRRYLSVYSVVNTLIERGTCSRVRIMIDQDGTGTGRPITFSEAGMSGSGDAEPFAHNGEIELTPHNTMREILDAVEKRDWSQAYDFVAMKNERGQERPTLDEFRSQAERANVAISGAQILDYVPTPDGTGAIVLVTYDLKSQGAETISYTNVPKRLILEGNVWKMTWNVFEQAFLG